MATQALTEQAPLASGNPIATAPPSPAALQSIAPRAPIDMRRIQALATRAESMVGQIRQRLLAPESRKVSPVYSTAQLAILCGVDKAHVNYRLTKGDLPAGKLTPTGGKREFTLSECRAWARPTAATKCVPTASALSALRSRTSRVASAKRLAR